MHMNKFLIEVFHAPEVSVLFSFFFHFTDFLKHFRVKKSFSGISGMFYIDQPLVIHSVNQKKMHCNRGNLPMFEKYKREVFPVLPVM